MFITLILVVVSPGTVFRYDWVGRASAGSCIVDSEGNGDYDNIQDAINAAGVGDIIMIWEGSYREDLVISTPVILLGNGTTKTVIEGTGEADSVIEIICDDVELEELSIIGQRWSDICGIEISNSEGSSIRNCSVTNSTIGIHLEGSQYIQIENVAVQNNDDTGIFIKQTTESRISHSNCSFNAGKAGIKISTSSNGNIISFNHFFDNDVGVHIGNGRNNYMTNNTFSNNRVGLESGGNAGNNWIFHNNFISNSFQGIDVDGIWGDSISGGNYWSDYIGSDVGGTYRTVGDGIGDTKLPHLGLDSYPYIIRDGWTLPGTSSISGPDTIDSDGNFTLSWIMPARTESFILEEGSNKSFIGSTVIYSGTETQHQVHGMPNGTHCYRLKARNPVGTGKWSDILSVVVEHIPSPPSSFSANPFFQGNTINLAWDTMTNISGYECQFRTCDSLWETLAVLDSGKIGYDHIGLDDGNEYWYRIRSKSPLGQFSNWTDVKSAVSEDAKSPSAPNNLSVGAVWYDAVRLNWNRNSDDDIVGYNLYRISEGQGPQEEISLNGPVPILEDIFYDDEVLQGNTYHYWITAVDEVPNESDRSNVVNVTIPVGSSVLSANDTMKTLSLLEDSTDDSSLNLYDLFWVPDDDGVSFSIEGSKHVSIELEQIKGTLVIRPEPNWNGVEIIMLIATDGELDASVKLIVEVQPSNDPPEGLRILSPSMNHTLDFGHSIDFISICEDPDIIYGDNLKYRWASNISGEFGFGSELFEILLPPGTHQIHLEVFDEKKESINDTVMIIIKQPPSLSIVNGSNVDDPTGDGKTTDDNNETTDSMTSILISFGILTIVLLASLILWFLILIQKRKEIPDQQGEEEGPGRPQTADSIENKDGKHLTKSMESSLSDLSQDRNDQDPQMTEETLKTKHRRPEAPTGKVNTIRKKGVAVHRRTKRRKKVTEKVKSPSEKGTEAISEEKYGERPESTDTKTED